MYKVDELVVTAGTEIRTHNLMLSTEKRARSQNNKIFGTLENHRRDARNTIKLINVRLVVRLG